MSMITAALPPPHWAAHLIGQAWTPERNCWWLVREFFRLRCGVAVPQLLVGDADHNNVAAIKRAAAASGWRRVDGGTPQVDDVLVMRSPFHRSHVGVVVFADGRLRLLHNQGHQTPQGPTGGVVAPPIGEALAEMCGPVEIWRCAA
jgi:hypothetical protein